MTRPALRRTLAAAVAWAALAWAPLTRAAPPAGAAEAREQAPPAPAGRLVVESETIDLGEVVRGRTAKAVFTLRNTGEGVLRILQAKPG